MKLHLISLLILLAFVCAACGVSGEGTLSNGSQTAPAPAATEAPSAVPSVEAATLLFTARLPLIFPG